MLFSSNRFVRSLLNLQINWSVGSCAPKWNTVSCVPMRQNDFGSMSQFLKNEKTKYHRVCYRSRLARGRIISQFHIRICKNKKNMSKQCHSIEKLKALSLYCYCYNVLYIGGCLIWFKCWYSFRYFENIVFMLVVFFSQCVMPHNCFAMFTSAKMPQLTTGCNGMPTRART